MKIVHFADLHLDTPFQSARPAVGAWRRQALRDALERILEVAAGIDAAVVVCAGDLYEQERFSPDTAQFLRAAFARVHPLRVLLAPGNHDWFGPRSLYAQTRWSSNVHVFRSNRLEPLELADGLTVWGAAHLAPANTDGFLDGFRVDRGGVNLGLFHASELGELAALGEGKQPFAPFRAEQVAEAGLAHAFVGHYHMPKDALHHTYPGNPEPLTFGEAGDRGAVVATIGADGSVARERVVVARSRVHDLTVDVTGSENGQEIRRRAAAALAGLEGVARLTLTGELGPGVELRPGDLRDVPSGLEEVILRVGEVRRAYDLASIAAEQTVRGRFVRDVRAAPDLDPETRRRVLVTGLRALDGRRDLEVD